MSSLTESKAKFERRIRASKIKNFIKEHHETRLHPRKIKEVIGLYKEWRESYINITSVKFSRKVLYYIAERVFISRFQDSTYIAALLNFIRDTDKGFHKIMFEDSSEFHDHYQMIDYFLHYAYEHKILIRGLRMACTKVFNILCLIDMAMLKPDPHILLLLLRYGAVLSYDEMCVNAGLRRAYKKWNFTQWNLVPLSIVIAKIKDVNPNLLPFEDLQLNPEDSSKYIKSLSCCELLLRDFPQPIPILSIIPDVFFTVEEFTQSMETLCINVLPSLLDYLTTPLKLKQICRLFIRKTLNEKWLLPHAIYRLPVPECLKKYLDLQYD